MGKRRTLILHLFKLKALPRLGGSHLATTRLKLFHSRRMVGAVVVQLMWPLDALELLLCLHLLLLLIMHVEVVHEEGREVLLPHVGLVVDERRRVEIVDSHKHMLTTRSEHGLEVIAGAIGGVQKAAQDALVLASGRCLEVSHGSRARPFFGHAKHSEGFFFLAMLRC